jgi:hypothetical protein
MGVFDDGIVFDHKQKRAYYYYYGKNRLQEVEELLNQTTETPELSVSPPT